MTDTATAPAAETPDTIKSDITTPQTADATPDAGKTEIGEPTAADTKEVDGEPEKKEPTQAELNKRERNRERWAAMKAKAQRAEALEAELAKLKGIQDPDWSQYADPNQEVADRVLHTLRKEQIPVLERQAQNTREEAHAIERQAFSDAVTEARSRYPDFDSVVFNPQVSFPRELVPYVAESEKGADVAYYLGKNPDVAKQLAMTFEQSARAGFIALGKIEASVGAPKAKPASTAPKPAAVLQGGTQPPAFDAGKASVGDMAAQLKKAGVLR